MARICGVDGCKSGWIALLSAENFSNVEWRVARNWTELALDAVVIAVDMPVGLAAAGKRGCDEAARKAPHMRPSSVFAMPVRAALDIGDYAAANAWSKANGHGGIVKQAWNLRPKLLQLEAAALSVPKPPIFEAHPELAFARMAGWALPPKKSAQGQSDRLSLLHRAGLRGLQDLIDAVPRAQAAPDDILDAAALLVTARRLLTGEAAAYPAEPIVNAQGITMRIWV